MSEWNMSRDVSPLFEDLWYFPSLYYYSSKRVSPGIFSPSSTLTSDFVLLHWRVDPVPVGEWHHALLPGPVPSPHLRWLVGLVRLGRVHKRGEKGPVLKSFHALVSPIPRRLGRFSMSLMYFSPTPVEYTLRFPSRFRLRLLCTKEG